ncbi:MAG: hypothetical protein ABI831_13670 [Betaproteobacteria bacterium]
MKPDISALTAAELDALISEAAKRRATLTPAVPVANPQGEIQAISDPRWFLTSMPGGTLLQLRDPGHGWLNYHIPATTRALLLTFLLQQALIGQITPGAVAAAVSASGGNTVH